MKSKEIKGYKGFDENLQCKDFLCYYRHTTSLNRRKENNMEKINDDITLIQGDCLEHLKKIDDKSVNAIITDPPYFLGLTHNGKRGNNS